MLEEFRVGRADDALDVEELGDPALDHGREQDPRPVGAGARDERLLDDVEDAADDQPDAPALVRVDDDLDRLVVARLLDAWRLTACPTALPFAESRRAPAQRARHVDQRQDLVAVLHHVLRAGPFEGGARELLQPGHQRQRDGHAAAVARDDQEHGLAVAGGLGRAGRLLGQRPLARAGDDLGLLGEAQDVEDQGHLAVAHDGGAGEDADALELLLKRLDHDLLGVVDRVHDQPELAVVGLEDDDVDHAGLRADRLDLELAAQVDQGQQVAPQPVDRRPVHLLDAPHGLLSFEPDQLQQADLRDRVAVAADGDGQGRDDGQRQRDLHLDGGAARGAALDVDRAADLLDVGPYHVHADAPAGEVRHPVGRREPGQEDEVDELAIARAGRPARG